MAVDEASLSISILAISVGAMLLMLLTGKPYTIYKGELSWVTEPPPRTRITISAPGAPSTVETCTPANRPVIASAALERGILSNVEAPREDVAPVRSLLRTVP